ncbi:Crp/Fnr family transcriptional regulator [Parerythrobacter jejuensis]|nr:Crp/Fnr family transcriptional regulator [Parerythrobacter jejuensis]
MASPSRKYGKEQLLQQRGDHADGFWVIAKGSVAVGFFHADGEFRAVALLGPGDSWGELAMFAGRPRVVDAIARTGSVVHFVRAAAFETILAERPAAMRTLLGALSAQLQETLDVMAGIRSGSAKGRVAGMLGALSGGQMGSMTITISQQELAELLGLTRATVSAALRDLEHAGWLKRGYGKIELVHPDELELAALS